MSNRGLAWSVQTLGLVAVVTVVGVASPGSAQVAAQANLSLDYHVLAQIEEAAAVESPTPRECKPRFMAGPGFGIAASPLAVVGGTFMIIGGTLDGLFTDDSNRVSSAGLVAGGSVLVAAGLGTLIFSSVRLSRNLKARRSVCGGPQRRGSVL